MTVSVEDRSERFVTVRSVTDCSRLTPAQARRLADDLREQADAIDNGGESA